MRATNDWNELLSALTAEIPADELEADLVLADIAGKLSAERVKRGMSQTEFAELLGVSQGRISKMESGDCNFSVRRLIKIAHKLGIPCKIQFGESPVLADKSKHAANVSSFPRGTKAEQNTVIQFPGVYRNYNNSSFIQKEQWL